MNNNHRREKPEVNINFTFYPSQLDTLTAQIRLKKKTGKEKK